MNHRLRSLALPSLLLAELGAVRLLDALAHVSGLAGPGPDPAGWWTWAQTVPPEDALAAAVRLLALGLAWWLLLSTIFAVVAGVSRWRPAQRAASLLTIRPVRAVVDRAVVGIVAVSLASGPTTALADSLIQPAVGGPPGVDAPARTTEFLLAPLPPVWTPAVASRPSTASRAPAAPAGPGAPPAAGGRPPAGSVLPDGPAPSAAPTHVIVAGQHLWWLAERTVMAADPAATESRVAAYWHRLVEANRHRLRSGDPDLVHPGEEIVMPPL